MYFGAQQETGDSRRCRLVNGGENKIWIVKEDEDVVGISGGKGRKKDDEE